MKKRQQLLLSKLADGEFHSGETLSDSLNISRAAIWKSIKSFRELGLEIESRRGLGYRLQHPLQLLDANQIRQLLDKDIKQHCTGIEVLFKTDSTNTHLSKQINETASSGQVVLSEYQSGGKGRRGNHWVSPFASGIYLSLAWRVDKSYAALSMLSLFTGVAVARSLQQLGISNAGLKWPNDILINHEKLGGVLVEMQGEANGPIDIIIGVGVNFFLPESTRKNIDQPVTDLSNHMEVTVTRNQVAAHLISNLFRVLLKTDEQHRQTLLEEWRQLDCYKNNMAKLILPGEEIVGEIQGIDEQGFLLMKVNGELRRYASGEVSLRAQL